MTGGGRVRSPSGPPALVALNLTYDYDFTVKPVASEMRPYQFPPRWRSNSLQINRFYHQFLGSGPPTHISTPGFSGCCRQRPDSTPGLSSLTPSACFEVYIVDGVVGRTDKNELRITTASRLLDLIKFFPTRCSNP